MPKRPAKPLRRDRRRPSANSKVAKKSSGSVKPKSGKPSPVKPAHATTLVPVSTDGQTSSIPPIVALGASAGGLEALRDLFTHTPSDTGFAFIMVMHLDPSHKSAMVELLSRVTTMPVTEAEEGMSIRPDHLYMIPPAKILTVRQGRLRIDGAPPRGEGPHPVDRFFTSVAQDQGPRVAAVIMSGMGKDGTLGCHAIKHHGGFVIVQSPESAKATGMPESAIAADDPDRILPPSEIPDALIEHFGANTRGEATKLPRAQDMINLQAALLRRTGHDFSSYKRGTIERRVRRRMDLRRINDYSEYTKIIQHDAVEAAALFRDLLVGVTDFFREPESWDALQHLVIDPLLTERSEGSTIRIWVPGCSTGQEAYSIGMLMYERMEALRRRMNVKIFATDLNESSLEIARAGIFLPDSVAALSPVRRDRFFIPGQGAYTIAREVRSMVIFARQSLIADPPFSRLDLVSCRNVLIYLDQDLQRRVLGLMYHGLRQGGFLILGNTESAAHLEGRLRPLNKKWRIYQRIGAPGPHVPTWPMSESTGRPNRGSPAAAPFHANQAAAPREANEARLVAIAHRLVLDRLAPASVLTDEAGKILYYSGPTQEFLLQPPGMPTGSLLELARPGLKGRIADALAKIKRTHKSVELTNVAMRRGGSTHSVTVNASPVREAANIAPVFLFVFEESSKKGLRKLREPDDSGGDRGLIRQLELDVKIAREDLQAHAEETETANEELKAANEEMMSMNEELQSSNEELETSKEELQSLNEELTTVNNQLQGKVEELEGTNNDLENLLASTDLATIFLDRDFNIRRFTPAIRRLVSLAQGDTGRPITDFAQRFSDERLLEDAREVLETLQPAQNEVHSHEGRTYLRRILPYRRDQDYIDGVVITFVDITERASTHGDINRLAAIVESSDDAIISKDLNGTILTWNVAAERLFGYTAKQAVGQPIGLLIPKDRMHEEARLIEKIRSGNALEHLETVRVRSDGIPVDVSITVSPLRDRNNRVIGASTIARDIRDRKAADEHQKAMLAELDHRVKNTLTVVLSLASQTMQQSKSLDHFSEMFEGRILALARAHQILSACRWKGGDLRELIQRTLAPQMGSDGKPEKRIRLGGPSVMMPPRVAVGLGMVFHELTTNAVKYGALQDSSGDLGVEWRVRNENGETLLECDWIETLKVPNEREFTSGFGFSLIEFAVRKDLGGDVKVDLKPTGLQARISVSWQVGAGISI